MFLNTRNDILISYKQISTIAVQLPHSMHYSTFKIKIACFYWGKERGRGGGKPEGADETKICVHSY